MTRIIKIDPAQPQEDKIKNVADALLDGKVAIIPTDTVYGLVADSQNQKAVQRVYEIKQRPLDKPFSLAVADKLAIDGFSVTRGALAYKLIDRFWPGPLTLILPAKASGTIGLRMPDNNIALSLISAVNSALVCPSANLSGKPAPVDFAQALADLEGRVDVAIDGGRARLGIESTIVDLTQNPFQIKRPGALAAEEIYKVAGKKNVLFVCTGNSCRSVMAEAYLKKRLSEQGRHDLEVFSAGILGIPNLGASSQTKQVLEKEGMSVQAHRSRKVDELMIKKSDIIFVMEKMHEQRVLEIVPEAKNRIFLLKEFVRASRHAFAGRWGIDTISLDIGDPIGQDATFYERTFGIIKESIERLIEIL